MNDETFTLTSEQLSELLERAYNLGFEHALKGYDVDFNPYRYGQLDGATEHLQHRH
jgi:hypothetical protein